MGNWIKVADRLPAESTPVLLWSHFIFIGYTNDGELISDDAPQYEVAHVTHWHELPLPPESQMQREESFARLSEAIDKFTANLRFNGNHAIADEIESNVYAAIRSAQSKKVK